MLHLLESAKVVIFDMDDTLYPPKSGIRSQITSRIRQFIQATTGCSEETARGMARKWYETYNSALQGLVACHNVQPEQFLHEVYNNINFEELAQTEGLTSFLDWLDDNNIRKVILTNSPAFYAERVLEKIGVSNRFERIIGIEEIRYQAKPGLHPYQYLLTNIHAKAQDCVMFEDSIPNLVSAKMVGMKTVLLSSDGGESPFLDACWPHFDMNSGEL